MLTSALTSSHLATLRALMDRIIPSDDFPGAWESGVGDYLTRQFEHDLRPWLETYRLGLEALEAEALTHTGLSFAALDGTAQDVILQQVEAGLVQTPWPIDPVEFFRRVVEHVMEGYYSDPGNSGNRATIAWHMVGFKVRG